MIVSADPVKNSVIHDIKKKIRLIILIASFVIVTLFGIIFVDLYKIVFPFLDFFSELPITVIIIFTLILSFLGLYLSITISRRMIRIMEEYSLRLDRLLNITKDLSKEMYGDILLEKIMDYALSITKSDAGSLLLMENDNLVFKILRGEHAPQLQGTSLKTGKGLTGWAAEKGLPVRIDDVSKDDRFSPEHDALTGYKTKSIMCIPLKAKEKVIGVLVLLNNKDRRPYRQRDEEIITYLADQAAISILKTKFVEDQKNYEIHVTEILLETIDSQLSNKKGHSKRVARYSNIMGKALNMPEEAQRRLYFASLLHDVGFLKMHSSDDVYSKEEFMRHPVVGYEMIKPINFYADIAPYILHHHERYDGYGYPSQLKGGEIPLVARIISIAEAFDAMTSATSYKIPISFEDALEELKNNAGTQFDPDLVKVFLENITKKQTQ